MGCRGVWGVLHCGGEGSHPTWEHTYQIKIVCPTCILCDMGMGWSINEGVVVLHYLSHSDGVSWSTSSHMWGSWYLPRFLLRDESLTQMYIFSVMVLVTPCDSLSTMVKYSKLTGCPVVWLWWCIGDRALRCCFTLSPNDLPTSPIYSSRQLLCGHLNWYITPFSDIYCLYPWRQWVEFR